jgi:hypothetical protein
MAVWDDCSTAAHSQSNVSIGLDVAQTLCETSNWSSSVSALQTNGPDDFKESCMSLVQ